MFSKLKKTFAWLQKAKSPFVAILRSQFGEGIIGKEKRFLDAYKGWVYACVNVIAEEVGSMSLHLMEGGRHDDEEDEEVFEHSALKVLHRPNPLMTGSELLAITSSHLDLDGNAFWYLLKSESGLIVEAYPLRPDRVNLIQDIDEPLSLRGYIYNQEDGGRVPLDLDEVLHFKNFNPTARYPFPDRGTGVVEPTALTIDTDDFAREWSRNFFLNSARPDAVLTYEGDLNADEFERLKAEWSTEHQGFRNAKKTAIMKGGMKYELIGLSQKDMEFIEQRRWTRDEILAMFRVPKTILGITEDVNRANAEASNFVFGLRVLKPRFTKIVEVLNEFYLPMFEDGEDFFFIFDSPVPEDREATLREYVAGLDRFLTRNEIRAKEGLPETEEGDTFFAPFGLAPQDRVKSIHKKREKPELVLKDLKERKAEKSKFAEEEEHVFLSPTVVHQYGVMFEKRVEMNVKFFRKHMEKLFEKQGEQILENVKKELMGLDPRDYRMKDPELFFDIGNEIESTKALFVEHLNSYAEGAKDHVMLLLKGWDNGEKAEKPRKVPERFIIEDIDLNTEEFRMFLEERAEFFARRTNEDVRERLFEQLLSDFEKNNQQGTIEGHIKDILEDRAERFNLDTVARTEISAIENFVNEEAFRQTGITKKRWETVTPDSKIDRACLINKKVVRKIGISKQTGKATVFPSGKVRPPEHPNCLCFIVPVK